MPPLLGGLLGYLDGILAMNSAPQTVHFLATIGRARAVGNTWELTAVAWWAIMGLTRGGDVCICQNGKGHSKQRSKDVPVYIGEHGLEAVEIDFKCTPQSIASGELKPDTLEITVELPKLGEAGHTESARFEGLIR